MSSGLSWADRLFVYLLARGRASSTISALEARPQRWIEITGGIDAPSSKKVALRQWRELTRSTLRSLVSGGSPSRNADVVHCEMAPNPESARQAYYGLFLPDVRVDYVSQKSQLYPGLPPLYSLSVLAGLLIIILLDRDASISQITRRRVAIVRLCFICLSHALASARREVYLMRLYQPHIPVLSATLMHHGVTVNIVTNPGPMVPAEFSIPTDRLVLTHPFQVGVALQWAGEREARSLVLWGPFDLPQIIAASGGKDVPDESKSELGIYTQGYWLRLQTGSISADVGDQLADLEEQLMEIVEAYLESHPSARAIHFPHPMERRHFAATGASGPWRLLKHPRVTSRYDGLENSVDTFELARVGVTTLSTVAYDRLYAGHPAFFYAGAMELDSIESDASIRGLVLRSPVEFHDAVDTVLNSDSERFLIEHFGGPLDKWQPDDQTLRLMERFSTPPRHVHTDSARR